MTFSDFLEQRLAKGKSDDESDVPHRKRRKLSLDGDKRHFIAEKMNKIRLGNDNPNVAKKVAGLMERMKGNPYFLSEFRKGGKYEND